MPRRITRTQPRLERSRAQITPPAPRSKRRAQPAHDELRLEWARTVPMQQWTHYRRALHVLRNGGVRFLLGGGFAMASYMGRWRDTKDMDLYILRKDRDKAVQALTRAGFVDYFRQLPYDRAWIYRGTRGGVIVDLIWAMANQRAEMDELWFRNASSAILRGESISVIPTEELLWCKLYILQRDHSDWTDVWNLLYAIGHKVDWEHLLWRLGEDWPLLKAALTVYAWLCPEAAARVPASLKTRLRIHSPPLPSKSKRDRVRLLDSRNWFIGVLPDDVPLQV